MFDLEGLARELDQIADRVESIGDHLVHAAAVAVWTSIAADAFRAQVARRRRDCGEVAGMLRHAAGAVRRFAGDVAAEKARLLRLAEEAARGVEGGIVSGAKAVEHGAGAVVSWVGAL
ncbi:MAG: hypothetical protein ACREFT_16290 [Acetobacteraceae bacterium]